MRMNVIYVYPLFCFICVFISENQIQIQIQIWKRIFLNLEIINGGGHLIIAASINGLIEADGFSQPPRLKS